MAALFNTMQQRGKQNKVLKTNGYSEKDIRNIALKENLSYVLYGSLIGGIASYVPYIATMNFNATNNIGTLPPDVTVFIITALSMLILITLLSITSLKKVRLT